MPTSKVTLEVYNPTGEIEITEHHAPRLDTLEGKTICELSDSRWEAHRTFPLIRELLQKRFPTAKFIPYTEFPGGHDIEREETANLLVKRGCDGAIIGNGG